MTDSEVQAHVTAAGELWQDRFRRTSVLNLTMLTDAGVTLARPGSPTERAAIAQWALDRSNDVRNRRP